jgi:hypothetical protein
MTALVITTGYNSPPRRPRDASAVFLPESQAFKTLHAGESGVDCARLVIEHPQTTDRRRAVVEDAIRRTSNLNVLAVFGHGHANGLVATGHGIAHVGKLAEAITDAAQEYDDENTDCDPDVDVILYACLTGRGKTGFADALADAMPWAHVYAHSTAGHATWNPYVELAGGPNGGDPIWTPRDLEWPRWRDRLRESQSYRLTFWHAGRGLPRAQTLEAIREGAK